MRKLLAWCAVSVISTSLLFRTPAKAQDRTPDQPSNLMDGASAGATPEAPKPFVARLADAYQEDWRPTHPAEPDPTRRGYPAPLDSPPFPSSDYSVGGTPVIGAPDTQTYPLMQAINENRSRIKVYGWINGGFNV